jgi:hypothetical protein
MKITIEADTDGETLEPKTFKKVTQCVLLGFLIRQEIAPTTFRECFVHPDPEQTNDLIGVLQAEIESLRDHKHGKRNGSDGTTKS